MRKQLTVLTGMVVVFAVVTSLFLIDWLNPTVRYPEAREGVLDAKPWNFAKQGIVPLRGEWAFYAGKLLTPDDIRTGGKALEVERRFVRVPGGWEDGASSGSGYGAGTYHLRVELSDPDLYSLRGKKIRLSSRIFMNGSDLGGTGRPDLSANRFVPSNLPFLGTIQAEDGTVDIVIQIASYRYLKGGLVQAPEFGLTDDVLARRDNARLADMIVITTMLVFGIYFAGSFKQWRKEPYLAFFSLFCLSLGLFFSFDDEIILASLFPGMSFLFLQKMLFILPYVSIWSFALYVYLYLGDRGSLEYKWLNRLSYVFLAVLIGIPNAYLVNVLWLGIVLQAAAFVFMFRSIFRYRNGGVQVAYILLGLFFLIISWVYAQTRYQLALDNPYYMIVTPLLLVLSQSFLMSDRVREAFFRNERLAEQLIAYDRQKDEFLVHTSHEFKTPLHGIINLAQVVIDQKGDELAPRHRENLDFIIAQATRLSALVNDIIDFQSLQRGSLMLHDRAFDVGGTVRATLEALKFLRRNEQVLLVNRVPSGAYRLFTDENRLKQILVNLVGNSLKFTDRGSVTVAAESRDGWLRLTFSDTGSGMSEERRRALFEGEPYPDGEEPAVSAVQSSGLGLKISKALAKRMGGDLELIASEPGKGSVFELRLPEATESERGGEAARAEAAAASETPRLLPAASPPKKEEPSLRAAERSAMTKILLVDDDPSNIKVLQEWFASGGYRVLVAYNGADALQLIQRHRDELSLVLLDVMMPELSGYEVCRRIREAMPLYKLPVLLLTVRNSPADIAMGLEAGANDFLVKPFSGQELLARVQTLLEMKVAVEQALRMETLFLQSQIKPHFVYNALSGIISLCYSDGARAGKLLSEFSNYLRLSFDLDPRHAKVSLKRELSLTKSYIELEKARFGERLNVEWDADVPAETPIPALILQPLVENAIRHGVMKRLSGGTVTIRAKLAPQGLRIDVRDDGVGMTEEQLERIFNPERLEGSIGLINVHKRLWNEFGQGLRIESVPDQGTTVAFLIPSRAGAAIPEGEAGEE